MFFQFNYPLLLQSFLLKIGGGSVILHLLICLARGTSHNTVFPSFNQKKLCILNSSSLSKAVADTLSIKPELPWELLEGCVAVPVCLKRSQHWSPSSSFTSNRTTGTGIWRRVTREPWLPLPSNPDSGRTPETGLGSWVQAGLDVPHCSLHVEKPV